MADSIRGTGDVVRSEVSFKGGGDKLAEPEANKQVLILNIFS